MNQISPEVMAPPDPNQDARGPSTSNAPSERLIAATLRDARMQMEEIQKTRDRLRTAIDQKTMEEAYSFEGRYWKNSHIRLGKFTDDNPTGPMRGWARTFALEENKYLDDVERRLPTFHEHAQTNQNLKELAAVDREFWGIWRKQLDFMSDISPLTVPPSGSASVAKTPSAYQSSDKTNYGAPMMDPTATKKRKLSPQPDLSPATKPLSKPVLKLVTPATDAADADGNSLSPTTLEPLKSSAVQTAQSPGPFAAPSPISLASSPDPNIPPSGVPSKPTRRGRSSVATASSWQTPRPPTPKSALASVETPSNSSPASAGDAQPTKRRKTSAAEPKAIKSAFTPVNSPKPSPQRLPKQAAAAKSQPGAGDFQGVTDLVVGEIYQAYYKDTTQEGWWMCTPLPWDDWEQEIGIDMDFTRADLWRDRKPREQYRTGKGRGPRRRKAILGWKGEYQDGGSKVTQRVFPVLFFDDVEGAPGNLKFDDSEGTTGIYTFPESAMTALPAEWVAAQNVRMPGTDVGRPVDGATTAARFRETFLARKALREEGS